MKVFNIIGAIVAVIAYSTYFYLTWLVNYRGYSIDSLLINLIHYIGMYTSLSIVFLNLAIKEKNRKLKFLVYIPMAGFFTFLIIIYLLNYIADILIVTDKPLLATAFSITVSLIWYLIERLKKWIQH